MKTNSLIFLLLIVIYSCNERTVQLPETNDQSITEIFDVSPIYFFYDEKTGDMEFNSNNSIGTTNWLVNIDKRLTLKQIYQDLTNLQEKRKKDGMHKNESARNYFTCSNPEIQNLAFIDFTDVNYLQENSADFINKNALKDSTKVQVYVSIKGDGKIDIGKNFFIKPTELDNFKNDLIEIISTDNQVDLLYLNFSEDLLFQDYISVKSILLELDKADVEISANEFIYK